MPSAASMCISVPGSFPAPPTTEGGKYWGSWHIDTLFPHPLSVCVAGLARLPGLAATPVEYLRFLPQCLLLKNLN